MSDFGGGYRIELPVEDQDEGISILLVVKGETFEHQISLQNETQGGLGHHHAQHNAGTGTTNIAAAINRIALRYTVFHSSF